MSPGKLAAQVGHCAEAYWLYMLKNTVGLPNSAFYYYCGAIPRDEFEQYVCGNITKTVCQSRNKSHLLKAKDHAIELGLNENLDFGLIYDKCLTELEPEEDDGTTLTGIWFKPLPDNIAHSISKKYHLYV